jgi:flagellar biosynthesis/type III secretory pathway protein FliH
MTDQTPRTEAGRTLWGLIVEDWPAWTVTEAILAIEAEARAYWVQRATECEAWVEAHPLEVAVAEAREQGIAEGRTKYSQYDYDEGRTEALREAAERVRALPETGGDIADIPSLVRRDAVLAILAGETER